MTHKNWLYGQFWQRNGFVRIEEKKSSFHSRLIVILSLYFSYLWSITSRDGGSSSSCCSSSSSSRTCHSNEIDCFKNTKKKRLFFTVVWLFFVVLFFLCAVAVVTVEVSVIVLLILQVVVMVVVIWTRLIGLKRRWKENTIVCLRATKKEICRAPVDTVLNH